MGDSEAVLGRCVTVRNIHSYSVLLSYYLINLESVTSLLGPRFPHL